MTLEELLNKLIEKGWKPRGEREPIYMLSSKKLYIPDTMEVDRSLRDLVSKESGLWQFVCENGMLNKKRWSNRVRLETSSVGDYIEIWTGEDYGGKFDSDYEYRLIEAALTDEDKLGQFLLDNIKIDE